MEITFSKKDLEDILTEYYCTNNGIDGKVRIKTTVEEVGYYGDKQAVTKFQLIGNYNILGKKCTIKETITENEYQLVIQSLLNEQGFEVEDIYLDHGVHEQATGYGVYERYVKKAYFNGLVVSVNKNIKMLKK